MFDLKYPTFDATLPVSKKKVQFRPFTVGEMKTLLIHVQGKSEGGKINDTIRACGVDVDVDKMPQADREFIFLQIRAKSIGEEIDLIHTCSCGKRNQFTLNFENDLYVEGESSSNIVTVHDDILVELKYPSIDLVHKAEKERTVEAVEEMVTSSIVSLTRGEVVKIAADIPPDELLEFVNGLIEKDFNKIESWILNQPKLYARATYDCSCGKKNNVRVTGPINFF